ncbi:MAG: DUF6476 family protein [Stellaceae bacterium]
MRALKLLVVAMGVLLVAGMAVLVLAVVERVNHRPTSAGPTPPRAATIELPPGAHVIATQATGERLVVRVGLSGGSEELLIFDLDGKRIATIALHASPTQP